MHINDQTIQLDVKLDFYTDFTWTTIAITIHFVTVQISLISDAEPECEKSDLVKFKCS